MDGTSEKGYLIFKMERDDEKRITDLKSVVVLDD